MRLQKFVPDYGIFPKGYGVAWRPVDRQCSICYPVPLNLIIGSSRNIYHWMRVCITPSILDKVYWKGHRAGSTEAALDSTRRYLNPVLYEVERQLERGVVAEETLIRAMGLKEKK